MTSPDEQRATQPGDDWLTIDQAAHAYGVSAKTIRRRIDKGQIEAAKAHDETVGGDRWWVKPPETRRADVVPIEIIERVEEAWRAVAEAEARAAGAERVAEFQSERRRELQAERNRLRDELEAERSRRWWQRRR